MLFETFFKNSKYNYFARISDGKISKIQKIDLQNEFYSPSPNGDYKLISKDEIKLIRKEGYPDTDSQGIINPGYRYIREKFWSLDNQNYNHKCRKWFLDIETTARDQINVEQCSEEIILIQIFDATLNTCFVFGLEPFENNSNSDTFYNSENKKTYNFKVRYFQCNSEKHILEMFFTLIDKLNPLIVFAWNGRGFDFPYLFKRAKKNFIEPKFSKYCDGETITASLSSTIVGHQTFYNLDAPGTFYLDYMDVYKKFIYKVQPSYSLDFISEYETGEHKVKHDCFASFDGFRTGEGFIFTNPKNEFEIKMHNAYEKNDMKLAHQISHQLFIEYGIFDTYLLKLIDDKLNLSDVLITLAELSGVNIGDVMGTIKPWTNLIQNYFITNNIKYVIPGFKNDNTDIVIKGGFVSTPQKGKHKDIFSVDINSAYPLLSIVGFNMSPETFIWDIPNELKDEIEKFIDKEDEFERYEDYKTGKLNQFSKKLHKHNVCAGINGAIFRKDVVGVIPSIINILYKMRKTEKGKKIQAEKEYELNQNSEILEIIKKADTKQMAIKIFINSLYGALGNPFFRLFNIEVARAITGNTRFYINLAANTINELLKKKSGLNKNFWIYTDTDSMYFTLESVPNIYNDGDDRIIKAKKIDNFIKTEIDPLIYDVNQEFAKFLNAKNPDVIKAEREVISDVAVFLNKKKYYMSVIDNEGVVYNDIHIKQMGIDVIKSSTPRFTKKYLSGALEIILFNDEQKIKEFLDNTKKNFINSNISEIAKISSVNSLDYDLQAKSVPINSRAALTYNKNLQKDSKYRRICVGDKIYMVYLKKHNIFNSKVIAFNEDSFIENYRQYIDFDTCWEKFFLNSFNQLIEPLNYKLGGKLDIISFNDW